MSPSGTVAKASKTLKEILTSKTLSVDENGTSYVFVKDKEAGTMQKVLSHIYNEELPEAEMDGKLLEAARHYQLVDLVKSCLLALTPTQLTLENVSKALENAYELDLPDVKRKAVAYIWDHLEDISAMESFKSLMCKNPNLMTDILVEVKKSMMVRQISSGQKSEDEMFQFTSTFPNIDEGFPVLLGVFSQKEGTQELLLPDELPITAKKVRIIYLIRSSIFYFVKMWSVADGVTHPHWIYTKNVHGCCQSTELGLPIDENNRKIFADTSLHSTSNDCSMTIFLTGYGN